MTSPRTNTELLRTVGLWLCPLGLVGMLAALAIGNTDLILIEGFLTVTGAVLSLHQRKPRRLPDPYLQTADFGDDE